jgi:hypothetical protein
MNIEGSILAELCDFFHYPVEKEIVLFAFRGCLPKNLSEESDPNVTAFKKSHSLKGIPVNYLTPRCTIGIWDRYSNLIATFPGSTLPSKDYVAKTPASIATLNVLCPGKYLLSKGIHPRNQNGFERHQALLMDGFGIVGIPGVGKTAPGFNSRISNYQVIQPGDNLHSGRTEPMPKFYSSLFHLRYSSSGCITIVGQPSEYLKYNHGNMHWNHWESFITSVSRFEQSDFTFLLFNYSDLKKKSLFKNNETIRYGSKQHEVGQIQQLLAHTINTNTGEYYYSGDIDCEFSNQTAISYMRFCNDYFSTKPGWEIHIEDFFTKVKHFNSSLIQPENAIH